MRWSNFLKTIVTVQLSLGFFILSAAAFASQPGYILIIARHGITGHGLQASVTLEKVDDYPVRIKKQIHYREYFELRPGVWKLTLSSRGFKPETREVPIRAGSRFVIETFLIPEDLSGFRFENPGKYHLHGYIVDVESGRPVAHAKIRLEISGLQTQSDDSGYFSIILSDNPPLSLPTDRLIVYSRQGKKIATLDVDLHNKKLILIDVQPGKKETARAKSDIKKSRPRQKAERARSSSGPIRD